MFDWAVFERLSLYCIGTILLFVWFHTLYSLLLSFHSYSDQTWIPNDEVQPIITRTRALTQLGPHVLAEQMQVR